MKNNEIETIRKNSKVKKVIIRIVCVILIAISFVLCEELLYTYKVKQIAMMGYTQYDLNFRDLYIIYEIYDIWVSENGSDLVEPTWNYIALTTYYTEKDKIILCEGPYTSDVVDMFNEVVSDYPDVQKRAFEYGITEDNPLTVEWILCHPREAKEIVGYSDILMHLDNCVPDKF